jgi:cyclopropane-fatty-acyl-phospholipid synthase
MGSIDSITTSPLQHHATSEQCIRFLDELLQDYPQWVRRLQEHAAEARRLTDDTTYRIWRLYMAGSAHKVLAGRLNTYHTLLLKGLPEDGLPLTRHGWYGD